MPANQQNAAHDKLSKNMREFIDGLADTLRKLNARIDELKSLPEQRKKAITAHVQQILTDLEPETYARLATLEGFPISLVESIFRKAKEVHVSIFHRMTGGGPQERVNALSMEFNQLKARLRAFIDSDQQNPEFADVRALAQEIAASQVTLADLEEKKKYVIEKYTSALGAQKELHNTPPERVPASFTKVVNHQAEQLRHTQSNPSDDNLDLLLFWALDIPTSGRTLLMDTVLHDHSQHAEDFGGFGGGHSGGAGASASFDSSQPQQALDPSTDGSADQNADPGSSDVSDQGSDPTPISTDDSLGAYS